jgi:hypothetical protein
MSEVKDTEATANNTGNVVGTDEEGNPLQIEAKNGENAEEGDEIEETDAVGGTALL